MTGEKFMPELQGFLYSTCGPFTKHDEKIQKFKETGALKNLYSDELAKPE